MSSDRPYLTTSADEAKKQIIRRRSARPDYSSGFPEWHEYNIQLLRRLFTTSELADRYKAETSKSGTGSSEGWSFLNELEATLSLYSPPASGAISSDRPYLTTSADEAKKQIIRRRSARPDYSSGFPGWHEHNMQLLRRLFTTSELADRYKAETAKSGTGSSEGWSFLNELEATLSLYSPPASSAMPSKTPAAPAQISSRTAGSGASGQWEFGTIEVANPARDIKYGPSSISQEGVFNMRKTLETLAAQGWELVSVVPGFQDTKHESIVTTTYRLFFKRPASPTR